MANEETITSKIKGFGMTTAFVVIMEDGSAEVKALKPTEDEIVELTKYWHDEQQKRNLSEQDLSEQDVSERAN